MPMLQTLAHRREAIVVPTLGEQTSSQNQALTTYLCLGMGLRRPMHLGSDTSHARKRRWAIKRPGGRLPTRSDWTNLRAKHSTGRAGGGRSTMYEEQSLKERATARDSQAFEENSPRSMPYFLSRRPKLRRSLPERFAASETLPALADSARRTKRHSKSASA